MPAVRRDVLVDVPPAALMAVLCDFAAYSTFLPDMEESTVLRDEGSRWTVRFAVRIIRRIEYTLLLERHGDDRLTWSYVGGAFKANSGGWTLTEEAPGRTRAVYDLDLDLGMFVPGSVVRTLLDHNLPATLQAFKHRAEAG
jgi:ribosome-associated toxin RatA of RatAB toxin-antitoxin module